MKLLLIMVGKIKVQLGSFLKGCDVLFCSPNGRKKADI